MDKLTDSMVGRRVGNYLVTSLLQEGGMGAVYLAEHPEIGRRVAIKALPRAHGQSPEIAERFLAEARAIARIDHPNVIDIYDFGRTTDGQLYYIMELLTGRELGQLMSETGPMPPVQIAPILRQICAGLQAAHAMGIVHRDLKPENIFLDQRGGEVVKILDFGIAKLLGGHGSQGPRATQAGMVMGTPYTIAPEQAAGRPDQIGPHTDIYSLGAILYWMLAGYPPFMAEPTAVILAQHIKDSPMPLGDVDPTLPAAVVAVVDRCLSKLPSERPLSALAVGQAFERAIESSAGSLPVTSEAAAQELFSDAERPPRIDETTARGSLTAGARSHPRSGTRGHADTIIDRWMGLWRWAIVGSMALALVLGTLLALGGDDPVDSPSGEIGRGEAELSLPRTASRERRVSGLPARESRALAQHEIVVTSNVQGATCHVSLDGYEPGAMRVPCRVVARAGQRLRVRVIAPSHRPYEREWTVKRDETLTVAMVGPADAGSPSPEHASAAVLSVDASSAAIPAAVSAAASRRGSGAAGVDAGKPSRSANSRRRKTRRRPQQTPQSGPEQLGSGTMAF